MCMKKCVGIVLFVKMHLYVIISRQWHYRCWLLFSVVVARITRCIYIKSILQWNEIELLFASINSNNNCTERARKLECAIPIQHTHRSTNEHEQLSTVFISLDIFWWNKITKHFVAVHRQVHPRTLHISLPRRRFRLFWFDLLCQTIIAIAQKYKQIQPSAIHSNADSGFLWFIAI